MSATNATQQSASNASVLSRAQSASALSPRLSQVPPTELLQAALFANSRNAPMSATNATQQSASNASLMLQGQNDPSITPQPIQPTIETTHAILSESAGHPRNQVATMHQTSYAQAHVLSVNGQAVPVHPSKPSHMPSLSGLHASLASNSSTKLYPPSTLQSNILSSSPISPRILMNQQSGQLQSSLTEIFQQDAIENTSENRRTDQPLQPIIVMKASDVRIDASIRDETLIESLAGLMAHSSGNEMEDTMVVTVTHPKKHGDGPQAYYSYKVQAHKSRPGSMTGGQQGVRRKFRDFHLLRRIMLRETQGEDVPVIGDENADPEETCTYLAEYLNGLATHPVFSQTECFSIFLTLPYATWSSYAVENENRNQDTLEPLEVFDIRMRGGTDTDQGYGKTPREALIRLRQNDNYIENLSSSYTTQIQAFSSTKFKEADLQSRISKNVEDSNLISELKEVQQSKIENEAKLRDIVEEMEIAKMDRESYVMWLETDPFKEMKDQAICIQAYIQQIKERFQMVVSLKTRAYSRGDKRGKTVMSLGEECEKYGSTAVSQVKDFIRVIAEMIKQQSLQYEDERKECAATIRRTAHQYIDRCVASQRFSRVGSDEAKKFVDSYIDIMHCMQLFPRFTIDELRNSFVDLLDEHTKETVSKLSDGKTTSSLKPADITEVSKEMVKAIRTRSEVQFTCF